MAVVTRERFASLAETTLTSDPGSGGTSLAVTTRTPFPQSGQFRLLVQNAEADKTNREIMLVTGGHGTGAGSFTVIRGQEGTSGVAHGTPSYVTLPNPTAGALERWVNDHASLPMHMGFLAWTYDPVWCLSTMLPPQRTPQLAKAYIPETMTLATAHVYVTTVATTPTAGENQLGVYLSTGTRIGTTNAATTATAFTSTGRKDLALTVDGGQSLTVTGGPSVFVWIAMTGGAATNVTLMRAGADTGLHTSLLPAAESRWGTLAQVGGGTALPASFTPSSGLTLSEQTMWAAVS
jgi:hypothetical protein